MLKDFNGLYFAALSTLGFGLTPILAKKGLKEITPLWGGTVSIAVGLGVFAMYILISGHSKKLFRDPIRSTIFFFVAGINNTLALALFYKALQMSLALIVVPVASIYPLITILLSIIFLKDQEQFNIRLMVGTLMIITGIFLVYIFR
jgi:transporter family protein